MRIISWVPLLACPAVFLWQALLGKPAVAPIEIPQCWRIHQVAGLFIGNPTLFLRIGIKSEIASPAGKLGKQRLPPRITECVRAGFWGV